jgi:tRNA (cytidine/uridine-2'-O-)-methyltransferase
VRAGHPQICLFQPEIPQNTGNIGRLAAATSCRLHCVRPFGFETDDKNLRRAGLDYWPFLDLEIHDDLEPLLARYAGRFALLTKKADRLYTEMPPETELLIFGRETTGLPESLLARFPEACYRIPIFHPGVRSLNLANAVSIVTYERLRMLGAAKHEVLAHDTHERRDDGQSFQ